ncbi:ATP-binding protein [Larkinella punicea]|uniref:Transcriptional regulator n=1 Tax=Larkinella punicea TaxID=2315727 RepID=A0A368JJ89_9BACT|nr:ATP-binding protein [Larkinella punicea]RCR66191.1 transcriptional regulator [Larkinella punicea]
MLSPDELIKLLSDMESDRIERTISTHNTDKFCEAVCAFSNDFPNHKLPGYLVIGVDDKTGRIININITDELLRNLAAIRDDGNVLPKPAITIQKYDLSAGSVVVVEVFPSFFPPVRYRGRIWIRNGPRKAIATEAEERMLTEKRATSFRSFDSSPAIGSSLNDINVEIFKLIYLPNAIDAETLAANHRELKQQLGSLRLYDVVRDCPTQAGILLLGNNPNYYIQGAYIQYVRFAGNGLDSDVINEQVFSGDLLTTMRELDAFVKNNIENRPISISSLQEEIVRAYPFRAIRELLNNAVMHRDYESNAPIKFYEFNDRIEITNPGGLYGVARPENFPHQNDYRNPVIAEALKIMGYVNRFNRGIATAKSELSANGNPAPEFQYDQPMYFGVKIFKRPTI